MITLSASNARKELYGLLDQVAEKHKPVLITGKRNNAVLVSEEDWRGITETLHLKSIPGLAESIKEGLGIHHSNMAGENDTLKNVK